MRSGLQKTVHLHPRAPPPSPDLLGPVCAYKGCKGMQGYSAQGYIGCTYSVNPIPSPAPIQPFKLVSGPEPCSSSPPAPPAPPVPHPQASDAACLPCCVHAGAMPGTALESDRCACAKVCSTYIQSEKVFQCPCIARACPGSCIWQVLLLRPLL